MKQLGRKLGRTGKELMKQNEKETELEMEWKKPRKELMEEVICPSSTKIDFKLHPRIIPS